MRALTVFLLSALASQARGQAFNIDFGSDGGILDSSYGGGAGQKGFWNGDTVNFLKDIDGVTTGVKAIASGMGAEHFTIAGATGGDKILMESYLAANSVTDAITVFSISPGAYDLYLYGWAAPLPNAGGVTEFGLAVPPPGTGSGEYSLHYSPTWPGGQVEGKTYLKVRMAIAEGAFGFTLSLHSLFGTDPVAIIQGMQIVPVPAPASALPLLGLLALARPRRN